MKKIILFLLLGVSVWGQTATGKEQSFPYGIRNKLPQTVTTASYLTTMGTDGTEGRILPSSLLSVYNPLINHLEYNNTDKTVWNNGKANVFSNTSFGDLSMSSNTTGEFNSSLGYQSSRFNTSGSNNVAIGSNALYDNVSGNQNTAVGSEALGDNVSYGNTSVGYSALRYSFLGDNNCALGFEAGAYEGDGTTPNDSPTYCIYIGASAKANTSSPVNEIAIGYDVIASGTNTATYGNQNITDSYVAGKVWGNAFVPTNSAPVNGATVGVLGEIRAGAGFIYVCSGGTVWTRATLTTY